MLRDAALLQLELVERSIGAGMMLKDSTPYNVQFVGARPVFRRRRSFEQLREGEPWAGYRQFCMLFLYPLMLEAWKDIPFQTWLRGTSPASRRRSAATCSRAAISAGAARSRTSPCTPGSSATTKTPTPTPRRS